MKYIRLLSLILSICLVLTGCTTIFDAVYSDDSVDGNEEVTFAISDYNLNLTVDSSFEDYTEDSPWDLKIADKNAVICVMAYKYIDLATGQTTKDVYNNNQDSINNVRDNFMIVESETTEAYEDKTITTTIISAEQEGKKHYYASYLVDFEKDGVFAWVMIVAAPSYVENNAEEFKNIVQTIEVVDENV